MPRFPAALLSALFVGLMGFLMIVGLAFVDLIHGDCGVALDGDRERCISEELWIVRGGFAGVVLVAAMLGVFCYRRLRRPVRP